MDRVIFYTPEQLAPVVAEGSAGFASPGQWVAKMRAAFAQIVTKRPAAYRSFGPYWWPLKRLMVRAGDLNASEPDPDLVAEVTLGDPALDIAAAFAFQEQAHANMTANDQTITVDTEGGDTRDYVLIDEEMDERAALAA